MRNGTFDWDNNPISVVRNDDEMFVADGHHRLQAAKYAGLGGAQAHIDGRNAGDVFSLYDVSAFQETAGVNPLPDVTELESELSKLVDTGEIREASPKRYFVV